MQEAASEAAPVRERDAGIGRLAWLDYAKAFAIALVVFGHASRSVERTDGLGWGEGLRLADQLIYTFHIPLFFVLAGYAASLVAGRGLAAQARSLLWGVVVPYVVWTVAWVSLKIAFPGSVNAPAAWSDLATALWLPVEHMWFLQHLLIARLYWMAAERAGALAPGSPSGSALIIVLLAVASWTATFETDPKVLTAVLGHAAMVGVGAIWVPVLLKAGRDSWLVAVAVAAFAAWLALALQLGADEIGLASFVAALLASLVVLVAVWRLPPPGSLAARTVAFVGEASLAIYVVHSIVIAAVRAILQAAGMLNEATLIIAGTAFGLVIPALMYWISLDLSARMGWPLTRYAGFGTQTRSFSFDQTRFAPTGAGAASLRI